MARGAALLAASLLPLGAGLFLASQHPLWPMAASWALIAWVIVAARLRGVWLSVLPAALPILNFTPWTGWLAFDEFDLLVLGALAGGFSRLAWQPCEARSISPVSGRSMPSSGPLVVLAICFGVASLLALFRGVGDAGGASFDWFDGYTQALNSVRVGKSALYALALWPLLRDEFQRDPFRAAQHLARGMQVGLAIVGLAALWERVAYPGLLDFSSSYRTTALFWEMHVGGGAIDAYLALATPFAAWALWTARSRRAWAVSALLALLAGHACLTTFSRGAYVGVALPLLVLGGWWWIRRRPVSHARLGRVRILAAATAAALLPIVAFTTLGYVGAALVLATSTLLLALGLRVRSSRWRGAAAMALALALMTEAVVVIAGGSFMRARFDASEGDFGARLVHWRHGLNLLSGPSDWLIGIGLGRMPANYARSVSLGEFSGAVTLVPTEPGRLGARLSGPATVPELGGLYSLAQRVRLSAGGGSYVLGLRVRASAPAELAVDVCEQHLLYARECQGKLVRVLPRDGSWQELTTPLDGPQLTPGPWYAPRLGLLSLAVTDAGAAVEMVEVSLIAPDGTELLANRDFSSGLAQWFPLARSYFTPWHIDNLFLELLVERGTLGLALFLALLGCALWRLLSRPRSAAQIAPFLAASLFGLLLVGSVSSVMDAPRIALLLLLLVFAALHLPSFQGCEITGNACD